jgi:hypothetical protein
MASPTWRACADGVKVQSLHYPGQIHGFVTFDLILHAARDALMHIGNAVAQAFARSPAERDEAERRAFGHRWQTAGCASASPSCTSIRSS